MTDMALRKRAATEIMGFVIDGDVITHPSYPDPLPGLPPLEENIASAFALVTVMQAKGYTFMLACNAAGLWQATFQAGGVVTQTLPTKNPAEAICRAAVATLGPKFEIVRN